MPQQPVALRLTSIADAIQGMFLNSEQMCLSAGETLGAALDRFGKLSQVFAALPAAFEGEDFQGAVRELGNVAERITAIGTAWSEEQGDLLRLAELSHKLTEPIERLRSSIRTICAVTIYAKVEVRSIDTEGDDLNSFIEDLTRLANSSQSTIEDYWAEHGKLLELLQTSRDAQAAFEADHRLRLSAISGELEDSIAAIARRRQGVADSAGDISQRSAEIGGAIGAIVMALQVGDATRQRIEHVKDGLDDIGAACADPAAAPERRQGRVPQGGGSPQGTMTAAAACRLQSRQIVCALEDFETETGRIRTSLGKLAGQAVAMVELAGRLFGGADDHDASFMATLKTRLDAAKALITESRQARASVDAVMASSLQTLTGLQQRVTKLSEIVVDMTLIGMNGILKSIRVGHQGKGLSVIAQELRNYANHAIEAANFLKPALQEMIAAAAIFEQRLHGVTEDGMLKLGRSMSGALIGVQRAGAELGEALKVLGREGRLASDTLKQSAADFGARDDLRPALQAAVASIERIAAELDDAASAFPGEALAEAFWSRYTMAQEREIHRDMLAQDRALAA